MMRFKLDENLPVALAGLLRSEGHDATTVAEQRLQGSDDDPLAKICQRERRALITFDLDFSDVRQYPPEKYPGLMVLRLKDQQRNHLLSVFCNALSLLKEKPIEGRLWIIEDTRIRLR